MSYASAVGDSLYPSSSLPASAAYGFSSADASTSWLTEFTVEVVLVHLVNNKYTNKMHYPFSIVM